MIQQFIDNFKTIDKKITKIMRYGLFFCLLLAILSTSLLVTYIFFSANPFLFDFGIALFRLTFSFAVEFIICGYAVDLILK